jgi:hypothetical protein
MKVPVVIALGGALLFVGAPVAHADSGLFLNWPLVPGPSGGPFTPMSRPTAGPPQPISPPSYVAPVRGQYRPAHRPAVSLGERDETGRIGPSSRGERDSDGRLLPTYTPR